MMKAQKVEYSKGVATELKSAEGVIVAGYQGLTFPQIDTIRKSIKESGNNFRVIKNTLLKKALNSIDITALDAFLNNSTALVIVRKDFAQVAKSVKKYSKDFAHFKVKAGLLEQKLLSEQEVVAIADLPSREQLLAQTLATMNAPIQNFVSVLANIPRSFLNVLNAIKDKAA